MAESLSTVGDAAEVGLNWPPEGAPASVAARIVELLLPPPARVDALEWLREGQALTAGRLVTALRRHGGALLADPVGSGKTFVALAAAATLSAEGPFAVLAPAPLVAQWRARIASVGLSGEVLSHSSVSRGVLPAPETRTILVDESHHYRHHRTARYEHLARFAVGRRVLLISATPVVNRLDDLARQLLLGVRDDALRAHGTVSLLRALTRGEVPSALGMLVIASPQDEAIPRRRGWTREWSDPAGIGPEWLEALSALTLDRNGGVAALVRTVLFTAAASSPGALHAALGRYAALLRQAQDARRAGRSLDRSALQRFTAEAPEQLLLWEMLPVEASTAALPVEDLERVEALRARVDLTAPDPKAEALVELLSDGTPTLVFTTSASTVPYLRQRLDRIAPAWVTGARAGWKHIRLPRDRVLEWFRPEAAPVAPHVLLASDVAAEGLDLQRARRVIHYDLPWTAMRLAQREGRSRRLGARHDEVEVVTMATPGWVDHRLGLEASVRRKARLPIRLGLEGEGRSWRWRGELISHWRGFEGENGIAVIEGDADLVVVALAARAESSAEPVVTHAVVAMDGRWSEEGKAIAAALERARSGSVGGNADLDAIRRRLTPLVRAVTRRAVVGAWRAGPQTPESRDLIAFYRGVAKEAARARDLVALARAERGIAVAARGHTAGEAFLIKECVAKNEELTPELMNGPQGAGAVGGAVGVQVLAALVVRPSCPR